MQKPSRSESLAVYRRLLSYTQSYRRILLYALLGFFVYAQTQWVWAELIKYIIESELNA